MFLYASIGALGVLHLVGVHLGDGTEELDLRLAIEGRRDVTVVRVDEIEPLAQLPVVALELEVRLLVVWIHFEHLLETLRRQVSLEEVLLVQRGELHEHVDLLALGRHHLELALEHRDQLRPLLEHAVHARQAAKPLQIRRLDLDHLAVNLSRSVRVVQAGLEELRNP